jgi:hypothetical protein
LLKTLSSLILLIIVLSIPAEARLVGAKENIYDPIVKYNKIHRKFFKQHCSQGADRKYYKLLKKYRGKGFYLPEVKDDIDRRAIQKNIHHFKKKITHIDEIIKRLKKEKDLADKKLVFNPIEESVKKLLEYKKVFYTSVVKEKKNEARKKSRQELKILKNKFEVMMNQVYFLKSYNYPNNHLENRRRYDSYKDIRGRRAKEKANLIYFYRRIVEDGAYDRNHSRPDIYIRSTLDTLSLNIETLGEFISENVRFDLEWTLKRVGNILNRGYRKQLERMNEWKDRTIKAYTFYKDIIKAENREKAKQIVKEKNVAASALKEYVIKKQVDVYHFWKNQKELDRALYVLSTILYNEVGTIDGEGALERKDVAQIVINRHDINFYRQLDRKQDLYTSLNMSHREMLKYPWLNVLFREGEFSFTYYYISSVSKIFCPDMSRRGQGIRSKNLKIAMISLKHERPHFQAIRYFSRVSMLGKVDMGKVWSDYIPYPERPGLALERQKTLRKLYLSNKYEFLYSFKDPSGLIFYVVRIDDDRYSVNWKNGEPQFYKYRSPHLFTYFTKK